MPVAEYENTGSYFDFEVAGELPEEGIVTGKAGKLRFKRIQDGVAVYESTLLTSGFITGPTAAEVFVPQTINGIPVTELHQTVFLRSDAPVAIENRGLKRVFITIGKKITYDRMKSADGSADPLVLYMFMLSGKADMEQRNTVDIEFYGNADRSVELCSVTFDGDLILHIPKAKTVTVNAQKTEIRGCIPSSVEELHFCGKVYPFVSYGWDGPEPNDRCFAGLEKLKVIDGPLSGEHGWSFRDCVSLEKIHLSNGIKKIPAYAFSNCRSLKDLYIPDTVEEIGMYAFQGCTNLGSIHLPCGLKKIPAGAFKECSSLTKVFLADTIEAIEEQAFAGCSSLRKPWIPKNIKFIAENAFPNPDR